MSKTILIVGGTSGIGTELARKITANGDRVVITGRDEARAKEAAAEIGDGAQGIALDLAEPELIAPALAGVGRLDGLVLSAIERGQTNVRDFDIAHAKRLTTLKLVGYTETVHALLDRLEASVDTGIVLFGGRAKDQPYPGSTVVSTVNGGVIGLVNTLAVELAPIRVNGLHPGVIGDSAFWADKTAFIEKFEAATPGGKLATVADVIGATEFLLYNRGVSGHNLYVDRGTTLT
jgi:NAD(P)-dependent dehydrogenase (short-subunit alcohol dehydrogenase family)